MDEQCCPRYPDCTAEFYEPHYCRCESWSPPAQARLDACTTMYGLRSVWKALERKGQVDLIYGAEWHHAVAHLRHKGEG